MIIIEFESWWVEHRRCLFDEKRQGGAKISWDMLAIKPTTDDGTEDVAACMAARNGGVTKNYLHDSVTPVVLGRDPRDREAIFYELWNVDRREAFFPVFLPGPAGVALWDMCAGAADLPLHKYIDPFHNRLPVHTSSNFRSTVQEYADKALYYKEKGILRYKVYPGGPLKFDMEVHAAPRKVVDPGYPLMSDPVGEYTLSDAIRMARQLE